jgi:ribosomal protein S18 acetylase RimI-like enzyme
MSDLFAALDATWAAAATVETGGWTVREGRGGGKRVSAATTDREDADIAAAEDAQAALGQPPLFCLRDGQSALDAALAGRGYRIVDPVVLYEAPVAAIAAEPPARLSAFPLWPPLAITREIWAEGHIGPERLAVMERVGLPKTAILGRAGDRAAGAVFAAVAGDIAMTHALHVDPAARRQGLARNLMRAAAAWAAAQGAARLALAVTAANAPANALYRALGMRVAGRYHYRVK